MMSKPSAILELRDVTIAFGGNQALAGVSFDMVAGEILGLIGPNGAGKSTLLRTICGFPSPKRGQVRYGDQRLTGLPSSHMAGLGISYLPQERTVFQALSVDQHLRLGGWSFRQDKARLLLFAILVILVMKFFRQGLYGLLAERLTKRGWLSTTTPLTAD